MPDPKQPTPPEERVVQPAYILAPGYYPDWESPDQVGLGDYVLVLWRRRAQILLVTLGCGLLAFIAGQLMPRRYEATATLLVQPPVFSTELKPQPLTVETYQMIVDSDAVKESVRRKLVEEGFLGPDEGPGTMETKLEPSKLRELAYSPVVLLVVRADSPEKAKRIADKWAETAVRECQGLSSRGKQGTLEFIETQYPEVTKLVETQERELKRREDFHDGRILGLEVGWSQRLMEYASQTDQLLAAHRNQTAGLLAEYESETARLRAEYESETERLRQQFEADHGIALLQQELKIKQNALSRFEEQLLETELAIKTQGDTLQQIRQQISTQPPLLVLSKAITDEALWARLGSPSGGMLPKELDQLKLRSELVNPTYQTLLNQLTQVQIEYETLVPKRQHLQAETTRVRADIEQLKDRLASLETELVSLQKNREAGLQSLLKRREAGLETLRRDRETQLKILDAQRKTEYSQLERRRDVELAEAERLRQLETEEIYRELQTSRASHQTLAQKFEAARLAKAEEDQDIHIGALAVAPRFPVSPRPLLYAAVAIVLGGMFSIVLAFSLEFLAAGRLADTAASRTTPSTAVTLAPQRQL
ncbi:MAG: hypothetical protein Kow001_21890 [Acidobacteriota bacterium]